MSKQIFSVFVLCITCSTRAFAEDEVEGPIPQERKVGHRAVIDVARFRKENSWYRRSIDNIESSAEVKNANIDKAEARLDALMAARDKLHPLSNAAEELAREITLREKELAIMKQLSHQDIERQKAQVVAALYHQMHANVETFANRHSIDVVFSYTSPDLSGACRYLPIPKGGAKEAKALFDADVIYQHHLDITNDILRAVNHR